MPPSCRNLSVVARLLKQAGGHRHTPDDAIECLKLERHSLLGELERPDDHADLKRPPAIEIRPPTARHDEVNRSDQRDKKLRQTGTLTYIQTRIDLDRQRNQKPYTYRLINTYQVHINRQPQTSKRHRQTQVSRNKQTHTHTQTQTQTYT